MSRWHVATFRVDASVPLGHSLCGGWIKPAVAITEPLYALGTVLLGNEAPVVLCAIDWTGLCNEAHVKFREKLAVAAHTTPERVAIQCVHQHNAPFVDLTGQRLVSEHNDLKPIMDAEWFTAVMDRVAEEVKTAIAGAAPVTHLTTGQAKVDAVASNRRLLGADGKIRGWRASACKDEKLRAEPEGLIDPWLKQLGFWNGDQQLVALLDYATHPMSYYGDGLVTSDFVGLAREARTKATGVPHVYFTGCAGNIAAGKYNDGDQANRFLLAQRLHAAMAESARESKRIPMADFVWRWQSVALPARADVSEAQLRRTLADNKQSAANRGRAALQLAYVLRAQAATPIEVTCLHVSEGVRLLHLPSETFVEYQLAAQALAKDAFVATAGYGDGGPWYVPTAKAFDEGGYEVSAAFVGPDAEMLLRQAMTKVAAR